MSKKIIENQTEKITKEEMTEQQKDRQPVRGMFKFYEVPNGVMKFSFRKHKGDPIETFTLNDGMVYTLPLGVAKHLNTNGWYPVHDFLKDETGKEVAKIKKKIRRFGFQSLEFTENMDLHEQDADIITVERSTF